MQDVGKASLRKTAKGGNNGNFPFPVAFLSRGTALLELIQDLVHEFVLPPLRKPFCPHYCLEVADLEQAVAELRAHQIQILKGPLRIEQEETWVYFADPDHNILEYIQWFSKK
jgi:lactoylglutathione lyase